MFGETFKTFSVNFVSPNPTGVFHRGEVVSGEMRFELSKQVKIQKMTMTVKGKAKVHWTTRSGSGKHRHTNHHHGKVVFFQLGNVVLQPQDGSEELVLQPGVHVYPFSCLLPQGDFPSTFEGIHGKISYAVIFGIHRAWHMEKTFVSEFKFERLVDIGVPQLLLPLSATTSRNLVCFCCVSGEVSMDVQMERKGFIPGETIKITAEFGNGTSNIVEPKATLEQTVTHYTNGRGLKRIVANTLNSTRGQPVEPNTSDVRRDMTLTIPGNAYATLENCEVLVVEYSVLVSLKVGGFSGLKAVFPIVIGSCRLQPQVPPQDFQPPSYNAALNM
ncbi:arrestin domain-containing protein 3-like [Engraulis encrasicolus]|uniref:arrestin domain-containing protein 3-like n=1 Tax=Engraulis encrasicolus TaxID=184585 RepID=UPI002FCF60A5